MKRKTLEWVVSECIATNPEMTKETFKKLAEMFSMTLDEFISKFTKMKALAETFGEDAAILLFPEFSDMFSSSYALDFNINYVFEDLYTYLFNEVVEIDES